MTRIAQLSGPAARLLLRLVELGGVNEAAEDTQREAGLGRALYFRAKAELVRLGFLDRQGNLFFHVRAEVAQAPASKPEPEISLDDEERDYYAELASGEVKPRQLAMLVDNLPWSGDPLELMRSGSKAQKRKRQQVPALQAIILYVAGWKVTDRNAKDMLSASGESVEEVYETLIEVKQSLEARGKVPDTPGTYLVAACRKRKTVSPPPVYRPADPDVDPGPQPEEDFHDPVYEAEMERLRAGKVKLMKQPWEAA